MSDHFGTSWVKSTRKAHLCGWCGKRIEVGSAASYVSGIFDGDFWSSYYHPECQEAIDRHDRNDLMEGWSPGDFTRGRNDDKNLPPIYTPDYRGKRKGRG